MSEVVCPLCESDDLDEISLTSGKDRVFGCRACEINFVIRGEPYVPGPPKIDRFVIWRKHLVEQGLATFSPFGISDRATLAKLGFPELLKEDDDARTDK